MNNEGNSRQIRPFPWKCGKCRQREVYPTEGEYTTDMVHDGRTYTVTLPSLRTFRCRNCGEVVLDTEANKQISQAFRRQAALLTPEAIRQNRKKLGLTQGELAERLSIAEATLSRWENGWQIQQRCLDKLMRLFFELPQARNFLRPKPPAAIAFPTLGNPSPDLLQRARSFRLTLAKRSNAAEASADQEQEQGQKHADEVKAAR
jgi:putative zinc finger/helix-turn-helix YgiT family protein